MLKEKRTKKISLSFVWIIFNSLLLLAMLIFFVYGLNDKNYFTHETEKVDHLMSVVLKSISSGKEEEVHLPVRKDSNDTYSYSFVPEPLPSGEELYLYLEAFYISFELKSGSEIVYRSYYPDSKYSKTGGDSIKMIKIDDKYLNKEMTLYVKANYTSSSGTIIPYIVLGEKSEIFLHSIKNDIFQIIVIAFLLVSGVILLIVSLMLTYFKRGRLKIINLSILSLLTALYISFRTAVFVMMFNSPNIQYILDYLVFDISPAFTLVIFANNFKKSSQIIWQKNLINIMILILLLNTLVQFILQVTGVFQYLDMRFIGMVLLVVSFLILLLLPVTLNYHRYPFKRELVISTLPISFIILVMFVLYLLQNEVKLLFTLGIAQYMFIVMQFIYMFRDFVKTYAENRTVALYKQLAMVDELTNLANRNAFESEIEKIKSKKNKVENLLFIFIDINNLKQINDTFSHKAGDILIRAVGDIILTVELEFSNTKGYRFGGDEFIILAWDADKKEIDAIMESIYAEAEEYSKKNVDVPLSFSSGYSIEKIDENFSVEELIQRADKKMYEHKHQIKNS